MFPERYSIENVKRVLANPRLLRRELFELATTVNATVHRCRETVGADRNEVDVMAADWDNLVILDACRYDMFAEQIDDVAFDGQLERVHSKGSDSWEFMEANFSGRNLHDTVYVTANPHVAKLDTDVFHAVENLLKQRWDEDAKTVRPEDVVEKAKEAHERFPEKRLILHFMQPHFPFLGVDGFANVGIERELENGTTEGLSNPWFDLIYSEGYDANQVVESYQQNLGVVMPHVDSLVEELSGKSVITADHGNLVGERGFPIPVRMYGHPRGLHRDQLLAVPWFEIESSERRKVVPEPPVAGADIDDDVVEQRLQHLGYS